MQAELGIMRSMLGYDPFRLTQLFVLSYLAKKYSLIETQAGPTSRNRHSTAAVAAPGPPTTAFDRPGLTSLCKVRVHTRVVQDLPAYRAHLRGHSVKDLALDHKIKATPQHFNGHLTICHKCDGTSLHASRCRDDIVWNPNKGHITSLRK